MSTSQANRQKWVQYLRNQGITNLAAALLEAVSPVTLIGAQLVHVGQPVLSTFFPQTQISGLLDLLEDRNEYQSLIHELREEPQA